MFEAIKRAIIRRSKEIIREEAYELIEEGVPKLNENLQEKRGMALNIEEEKMEKQAKRVVDELLEEHLNR